MKAVHGDVVDDAQGVVHLPRAHGGDEAEVAHAGRDRVAQHGDADRADLAVLRALQNDGLGLLAVKRREDVALARQVFVNGAAGGERAQHFHRQAITE